MNLLRRDEFVMPGGNRLEQSWGKSSGSTKTGLDDVNIARDPTTGKVPPFLTADDVQNQQGAVRLRAAITGELLSRPADFPSPTALSTRFSFLFRLVLELPRTMTFRAGLFFDLALHPAALKALVQSHWLLLR